MRIIYDKDTREVLGINKERKTAHLPPSAIGSNSTYIDIDYSAKALKKNKIAKQMEAEKNHILGKKFLRQGQEFSFERIVRKIHPTVLMDLKTPKFHKDVETYVKKAKDQNVTAELIDHKRKIVITIKKENKVVGTMNFIMNTCCSYLYQEGKVDDRDAFPHYVGLHTLYNHLKDSRFKFVDLGGLTTKNEGINKFKRKWGKETSQDYQFDVVD